jgi:uncharacterized protein
MSESDRASLLSFPCEFPIKVFGTQETNLRAAVLGILRRHLHAVPDEAIGVRSSRGGKYTALTITITATSQQQLDAI